MHLVVHQHWFPTERGEDPGSLVEQVAHWCGLIGSAGGAPALLFTVCASNSHKFGPKFTTILVFTSSKLTTSESTRMTAVPYIILLSDINAI